MFNPDEPDKRMGEHEYEVEGLDLSEQGYPGLSFTGMLDIGVDNSIPEWYVRGAYAPDMSDPQQNYREYKPQDGAIGAAIVEAVYQDERLSAFITDACYYHGED